MRIRVPQQYQAIRRAVQTQVADEPSVEIQPEGIH